MGQMERAAARSVRAKRPRSTAASQPDRALGLVPFAVKLNGDLVQQPQTLAKERGTEMNSWWQM